jgi:hypothetical protein
MWRYTIGEKALLARLTGLLADAGSQGEIVLASAPIKNFLHGNGAIM